MYDIYDTNSDNNIIEHISYSSEINSIRVNEDDKTDINETTQMQSDGQFFSRNNPNNEIIINEHERIKYYLNKFLNE